MTRRPNKSTSTPVPRRIGQGSRVRAADGDPVGIGTVITPVSKRGEVPVRWDVGGPDGKPRRRAFADLVALTGGALVADRKVIASRLAGFGAPAPVKQPPRAREVRGGLPGQSKRGR